MFIYVNITKIMKIILFSCKNNCFSTKKKASNRCQTQKLSYFKIKDINCLYLSSTTKLIQFYFGESKTQNFLLLQIFTSLKNSPSLKFRAVVPLTFLLQAAQLSSLFLYSLKFASPQYLLIMLNLITLHQSTLTLLR